MIGKDFVSDEHKSVFAIESVSGAIIDKRAKIEICVRMCRDEVRETGFVFDQLHALAAMRNDDPGPFKESKRDRPNDTICARAIGTQIGDLELALGTDGGPNGR